MPMLPIHEDAWWGVFRGTSIDEATCTSLFPTKGQAYDSLSPPSRLLKLYAETGLLYFVRPAILSAEIRARENNNDLSRLEEHSGEPQ